MFDFASNLAAIKNGPFETEVFIFVERPSLATFVLRHFVASPIISVKLTERLFRTLRVVKHNAVCLF